MQINAEEKRDEKDDVRPVKIQSQGSTCLFY